MQRGNAEKAKKRYCVVSFSDNEEDLFIVSSRWLTEGKSEYICLWPPYKGDARIKRAVMEEERPSSSWLTCSAKLIKKCKTYKSAENFLNTVLLVSNKRSCIVLHQEAESTGSTNESPLKRIKIEEDSDIFASNCGSSSSDSERPSSPIICESATVTVAEIVEESSTECTSPSPAVVTRSSNSSSAYQFLMENTSAQAQEEPSSAQDVVDNFNRSLEEKLEQLSSNQKNMERVLMELATVAKDIQTKLDCLISKMSDMENPQPSPVEEEDLTMLASLPVGINDFFILDRKVMEKNSFRHKLMKLLMLTGGRDGRSLINNLLRKIMLDDAAEQFSLTGKTGKEGPVKQAFEKFAIYKLILEICGQVYPSSENLIRDAVSEWLTQAKFRKSRRLKRAENSISEENFETH